jgi:hypothetical protein
MITMPRTAAIQRAFLGLISTAALLAVGCSSTQPTMVATLPPPSFEGPRIVKPAPLPPKVSAPVAVGPQGPAAWTPRVPARPWRWIVIHHSASPTGSAAVFDKEHKAKGWDGVGYHFVIGNGTMTGDGQVEVTPRWPVQKWGAHAKTLDNRYNEYGIGICLVGNFDNERPTSAQMKALTELVAYLMQTYRIPASNVVGHRDTKPTDCPGRWMNLTAVRQLAVRAVVATGGKLADADANPDQARPANVELLGDASR